MATKSNPMGKQSASSTSNTDKQPEVDLAVDLNELERVYMGSGGGRTPRAGTKGGRVRRDPPRAGTKGGRVRRDPPRAGTKSGN